MIQLIFLGKGTFEQALELRASICLVDPNKLNDPCYTTNEAFVDQIALADVLVANKMDLADEDSVKLLQQWAKQSSPKKSLFAQTQLGQLDTSWLDIPRNSQRQAKFPNAHINTILSENNNADKALVNRGDDYQSLGHFFTAQSRFDFAMLNNLLSQTRVERINLEKSVENGF